MAKHAPVKCFWIEPVEWERVWLRRYRTLENIGPDGKPSPGCPLPWGYHDHKVFLDDRPSAYDHALSIIEDLWPTHCDCGYEFQEEDTKQVFTRRLFKGAPDGELYTLQDVPPGALWDADWTHHHDVEWMKGPDGMSLHVKLPNGNEWCIDSEASNCTRTQFGPVPGEPKTRRWGGRTHYCWCRHGDPRTGMIHVDKQGNTCRAGAGSIVSGDYHGFLHHGYLRSA